MTARIRHGDGDRRLLAYADLAPFVEAQFDQLVARLERPVFACCDSPARPGWNLPSLRGRTDRRPAPGPGRLHPSHRGRRA